MKKLLTFLFLLIYSITYSQSGVGYLNYTVYNMLTYQYGAGSYANTGADFDKMFNTANGTTIFKSGVGTAAATLNYNNTFLTNVPNGAVYFGIKTYGYFVPKETGTYSFGVDGDDGVDVVINGNMVTSFYGPHGFGGLHYGTVNLVAGQSYTFVARFQQVGGGWGLQVMWKRPSQTTWSIQPDEVTSTPPAQPTKKAIANFNLNTNLTATTFAVGSALSSVGSVDITTLLDSNKVANGYYKMSLAPGQVEWVVAKALPIDRYGYSPTRILVDLRTLNSINPSNVSNVKFLDAFDGFMTYVNSDIYWAQYDVLSPDNLGVMFGTETNGYVGTSQYLSSIRNMGGYQWALKVDPTFTPIVAYKPQTISLSTTNNLTTLYNSIVTVSDVYMAFQEYSNQGLFGNQSGTSFTKGIQYQNADVNDDGVFNEADCFLLLQNLTGSKSLVDTFNLNKTIRIIPQSRYDSIGKSNWNTFTNPLGSSYTFDINTGKPIDTLNFAVAWKGDVNLSHSTTPKSNGITTMSIGNMAVVSNEINASIMTEVVGDSIYAYITLDPLSQNVVGTQFQLNYDNSVLKYNGIKFTTKGSPTNYSTDKGSYINLGSLISDGSTSLDNTTTYKISFSSNTKLDNIFGLISIGSTDAVNKSGTTLKVRIN